MPEDRLVELPGVSLFVRRSGDPAAPTLLAFHGGPPWDHSYLLPALDDVGDVRHVVLFDLRGCGRSSRDLPADSHQPDLCVDDAAALVALLDVDRLDILGFSYGGALAMLFAERHPAVVNRLVLASTTAYADITEHLGRHPEYRQRSPAVDEATTAIFTDESIDGAERTKRLAMATAPMNVWNLELLQEWRAVLGRVRFSGAWDEVWLSGRLRSPRPTDPAAVLRSLARPTLILHGEQDLVFPVDMARRLHEEVPHSELAIVPDAGHATHFERRAEWVGHVRAFLAQADGPLSLSR